MAWYEEGENPDYRFSLANERTFLAWIRTTLAILAVAILLKQFSVGDVDHQQAFLILSIVLSMLACITGVRAYFIWRNNEHAMRLGKPLPLTRLIFWLALAIAIIAGGIFIWLLSAW